jgi:hypothetical protein
MVYLFEPAHGCALLPQIHRAVHLYIGSYDQRDLQSKTLTGPKPLREIMYQPGTNRVPAVCMMRPVCHLPSTETENGEGL